MAEISAAAGAVRLNILEGKRRQQEPDLQHKVVLGLHSLNSQVDPTSALPGAKRTRIAHSEFFAFWTPSGPALTTRTCIPQFVRIQYRRELIRLSARIDRTVWTDSSPLLQVRHGEPEQNYEHHENDEHHPDHRARNKATSVH